MPGEDIDEQKQRSTTSIFITKPQGQQVWRDADTNVLIYMYRCFMTHLSGPSLQEALLDLEDQVETTTQVAVTLDRWQSYADELKKQLVAAGKEPLRWTTAGAFG